MKVVPYIEGNHSTFEEEWNIHENCSEWWYSTGYFNDVQERLYSFQFTLLRVNAPAQNPHIIMLALTDFTIGKHHYFQDFVPTGEGVVINESTVGFGEIASFVKQKEGMRFTAKTEDYSLDLMLDYGKGAFWHCDNGYLKMGINEPKQTTYYYSYTNMPTSGSLTLNGEQLAVTGKSWFDKQGGTYNISNPRCNWEWFSLRFFDNEEIMLFTFPQNEYIDGTYISKDGISSRLNEYTITATNFIHPDGTTKYSNEWKLTLPGLKEQNYSIKPLLEGGQMNMGYFELLAGIYNEQNEKVGLCFVELLPGARNTGAEGRSQSLLFSKSK